MSEDEVVASDVTPRYLFLNKPFNDIYDMIWYDMLDKEHPLKIYTLEYLICTYNKWFAKWNNTFLLQ